MVDTVERFYKITADGSDAVKALNQIADATKASEKNLSAFHSALKDTKKLLEEAFAIETFKKVVEGFKSIVESMAHIEDESKKLGVGTDELQRLEFAAKQSGVPLEALY